MTTPTDLPPGLVPTTVFVALLDEWAAGYGETSHIHLDRGPSINSSGDGRYVGNRPRLSPHNILADRTGINIRWFTRAREGLSEHLNFDHVDKCLVAMGWQHEWYDRLAPWYRVEGYEGNTSGPTQRLRQIQSSTKPCEQCGEPTRRRLDSRTNRLESPSQFAKRRYCSVACRNTAASRKRECVRRAAA